MYGRQIRALIQGLRLLLRWVKRKSKTQICTLCPHDSLRSSRGMREQQKERLKSLTSSDSCHVATGLFNPPSPVDTHSSVNGEHQRCLHRSTVCTVTSSTARSPHCSFPAKASQGNVMQRHLVEKPLPFDYVSQLTTRRHVLIFPSVCLSFTQPTSMLC